MAEYVSKTDAVNAVPKERIVEYMDEFGAGYNSCRNDMLRSIKSLEPADVVPTESQEIGYGQCANAMLKMWMDNVVTDGEYNRIMDRLNKLYLSRGEREE